jgi:glycerol-3-phosphate O-acyltransferase
MLQLRERGGQVYVPRADEEYAVDVGIRMLSLRHIITGQDGLISAVPGQEGVLHYYANAIAHILPPQQLPAKASAAARPS